MIIFSWTLTPNQVACLQSVAEYHALDDSGKLTDDTKLAPPGVSNWIGATRLLFREGLIRTRDVPVPNKVRAAQGWSGPTRPKWEITEKGLLMLQLVAIEVTQQQDVLQSTGKALKRLERMKIA